MISIALASYNGERFIKEQIDSILSQLKEEDELVISDNNSTDRTVEIIKQYGDKRIKLVTCDIKGVVANFSNALMHTSGDIIFLSDQDDVWLPGKVDRMASFIGSQKPQLVLTNAIYVDENLNPLGKKGDLKKGYLSNLIKATFGGAVSAFNRLFMELFLPFPECIPLHDWYIGLLAEKMNYEIIRLEEDWLLYRRHEATVTGRIKNSLKTKIKFRLDMIKGIKIAVKRIKKNAKAKRASKESSL